MMRFSDSGSSRHCLLSSVGAQAKDATAPLIPLLKDPVFGIRQAVAGALSRIAPTAKEIVPALVNTLADERNNSVREAIVRALGDIGTSEAVTALIGRLTDHEPGVRRYAVIALKVLGPRASEAVAALQEFMANETDPDVRNQAESALRRMTEQP